MAEYTHKEGSFTLFKNDRKTADHHPDWKGNGTLNGKKMDIAAWTKGGARGEFLSIKVSENNYKPGSQQPPSQQSNQVAGMQGVPVDDESIPF